LTSRYIRGRDAVLVEVESLPEPSLRNRCPDNQCSTAALAGHIAGVHATVAGWVELILAGKPLPTISMTDIDRNNAAQAVRNDGLSKAEVLGLLQSGSAAMKTVLQDLSDEDLERSTAFTLFGGDVNVKTLVEQAVIAHTEQHLASLRAATGNPALPTDPH